MLWVSMSKTFFFILDVHKKHGPLYLCRFSKLREFVCDSLLEFNIEKKFQIPNSFPALRRYWKVEKAFSCRFSSCKMLHRFLTKPLSAKIVNLWQWKTQNNHEIGNEFIHSCKIENGEAGTRGKTWYMYNIIWLATKATYECQEESV